MQQYRLCIITPDGTEHKSTQTFPRADALCIMLDMDRMDGSVVYLEVAEYAQTETAASTK